jgi:hypothetical protein
MRILVCLIILILPVVAAGTDAIIEYDWFGCTSQSDFRLLRQYQEERDFRAFDRALADGIQHMRATKFRAGESVYIESTAFELVQLRRPGEVLKFWTSDKAIRKLPNFSS